MKPRTRVGAFLVAVLMGVGSVAVASSPAHASSWGPYLVKNEATGYCLGIPSYSYDAGAQFQLDTCDHAPAFYFNDTGFNPYEYYIQVIYSGYCVQPGAPLLQNSTLVQWECGVVHPQRWKLQGVSNGAVLIQRVPPPSPENPWCMNAESSSLYSYVRQNYCTLLGRWVLVFA